MQDRIHIPVPADTEGERDYSMPDGDDQESLARDLVWVRSLQADDLDHIVRIDQKTTGRERREYLADKLDEVMQESAVRVSLVAEVDGIIGGFVMARVDFGDFGHTAPTAALDTISVNPGLAGQGIGRALMSQLLVNLSGLQVETLETQVARENFDLLRFFYSLGGAPSQRLAFRKPL